MQDSIKCNLMYNQNLPVVAIIGRPNVGKSTLFNRIIKENKAIVDDKPGVTRDRLYSIANIDDKSFILIDTGGIFLNEDEEFEKNIKQNALVAIEEADIILFLLDGKEGITHVDIEILDILRKSGKKVFFIINKIDSQKDERNISDFYSLGIDKFYLISAVHKKGLVDLFIDLYNELPDVKKEDNENNATIIGIIGRPNTGKSSLVNKILGYERVIVSDIPGTTRDPVDTFFTYNNKNYILIDTAGIRRKSRISYKLEKYSVVKAISIIERSNIVLLMIDASEGVTDQDKRLARLIDTRGKGLIILLNKWDLIKGKVNPNYLKAIEAELGFVDYAPFIKISALTGMNVKKIFNYIEKISNFQQKRIQTSKLNKFVHEIMTYQPPPSYKGKRVKINYITQVDTNPPKFIFFTNIPEGIKESYKRFLTNRLREEFKFTGVPIRIFFKKKN